MISIKKYVLTIVALVIIAVGSFFGGLKLGGRGYVFKPNGFQVVNENGAPSTVDYSLLWQAMSDMQQNYIDWGTVDQQKLLYGAVSGMVAAAGDPYTTFFDPTAYAAFNSELTGTFSGIGAQVGMRDGYVAIVAPLKGSPAEQAGLKSGDKILKINGADATTLSLDEAVTDIRGPQGTQVTLSIYRPSTQVLKDYTITRQTINVPSVTYSVKTDGTKKLSTLPLARLAQTLLIFLRKLR